MKKHSGSWAVPTVRQGLENYRRDLPPRHGLSWLPAEDAWLARSLNAKIPLEEIAKFHKRSLDSIATRAKQNVPTLTEQVTMSRRQYTVSITENQVNALAKLVRVSHAALAGAEVPRLPSEVKSGLFTAAASALAALNRGRKYGTDIK